MSAVSEVQSAPLRSNEATYTATFELGEDGWWAAQIVEVPEAISQGRTIDEARTNVADALVLALDLRAAEGREIPPAGNVAVAPVTPARRSCAAAGGATANRSRTSAAESMRRGGTSRVA